MTSEIQQNRYDQILRRVAGLIGPGSKVSEVITELFPMFDVEKLPGELYILGGTHLGYGGTFIAAAGGQFPAIQLFNPADSGKLVTLTSAMFSSNAVGSQVRWSIQITELSGSVTSERIRDTRVPFQTRTSARIRSESLVAITGATAQIALLANEPFVLEDPDGVVILSPGAGFNVAINSAGSQLFCSFYWRERTAEQSELNI